MASRLLAALIAVPATARTVDARPPGPDWTEANRTAEFVIFTREDARLGARDILAVTELDASPALAFEVLGDFDHYAEFMPYTKETRILERTSETRLKVYQRLSPPVVSDRDYVIDVTLSPATDATKGVFESRWTSAPDAIPTRDGCVRVRLNSGSWTMEPLDGGRRTRLTHRLQTHPGGSIPTWVADKSNTVAIPELLKAVAARVAQVGRP